MGFEQTWPQTVLWNEHKRFTDKAFEFHEAGDKEKFQEAMDAGTECLDAWGVLLHADPRWPGSEG